MGAPDIRRNGARQLARPGAGADELHAGRHADARSHAVTVAGSVPDGQPLAVGEPVTERDSDADAGGYAVNRRDVAGIARASLFGANADTRRKLTAPGETTIRSDKSMDTRSRGGRRGTGARLFLTGWGACLGEGFVEVAEAADE